MIITMMMIASSDRNTNHTNKVLAGGNTSEGPVETQPWYGYFTN